MVSVPKKGQMITEEWVVPQRIAQRNRLVASKKVSDDHRGIDSAPKNGQMIVDDKGSVAEKGQVIIDEHGVPQRKDT